MESVEKDIDTIKNIRSVTCNSGRWPASGLVEFVDTWRGGGGGGEEDLTCIPASGCPWRIRAPEGRSR